MHARRLSVLLPIFAAALMLGGCPNMGMDGIDPPALVLELPPPPPHITHIITTNGAGKTLMDSGTGRQGQTSANPPLTDLDGRLTIISTWSDGRKATHQVTHTPGQPVNLFFSHVTGSWLSAEFGQGNQTDVDAGD